MTRHHRVRPVRRRAESGYQVDVWRSVAILLTDDSPLAPESRRLLAASLIHIFGQGSGERLAGLGLGHMSWPDEVGNPDAFVDSLRELYRNGFIGVEDGRAFLSFPGRDALGRIVARRIDDGERDNIIQAFADSLKEDDSEGGAQ